MGKRWLMTVQLPKLLANFEVYYYTISPSINILFLRSTYSQRRSKQREKFRVLLTVRARVDLIVVAPRKNVFFHNSPKVVVGHGLKDYGVKNLFTM